jgi:type I restriction enzyme S subunit
MKQVVQPGDVLLCKIIPHLNRVWIVGEHNGHRKIASSEWIVVRCPECDGDYLRYSLSEPVFREEFLKELSGVGGSLVRARPQEVARIKIPIAPFQEQQRIASKLKILLGRQQRVHSELGHLPKLIKRYKQAVLTAAFRGDTTANWRLTHSEGLSAQDFYDARRSWAIQCATNCNLGRDQKSATIARDRQLEQSLSEYEAEQPLPRNWR